MHVQICGISLAVINTHTSGQPYGILNVSDEEIVG